MLLASCLNWVVMAALSRGRWGAPGTALDEAVEADRVPLVHDVIVTANTSAAVRPMIRTRRKRDGDR